MASADKLNSDGNLLVRPSAQKTRQTQIAGRVDVSTNVSNHEVNEAGILSNITKVKFDVFEKKRWLVDSKHVIKKQFIEKSEQVVMMDKGAGYEGS